MKTKLNYDLKELMKAKDAVRRDAVRNIKKTIMELETSKGHSGEATDAEILKIIQKMVKQGRDVAEVYRNAGRQDLYETEMTQVEFMEGYLPKQMTPEEVTEYVKNYISTTGVTQMSILMKELNKDLAGRVEGKVIAQIVKQQLT